MNDKYVTDEVLKTDQEFRRFLEENPSIGYLKVRASAAYQALPISGVNVRISKEIGDWNVIFFEGVTDNSGVINNISLPAPSCTKSDLDVPNYTKYRLTATGSNQNVYQVFDFYVYCGITVVQDINVIPKIEMGRYNGN